MNDPIFDDELRALYDRQREADQQRAPSFHTLRTRALAVEDGATRTKLLSPLRRWWPTAVPLAALLALMLAGHRRVIEPEATSSPHRLVRELEDIDLALRRSAAAEELVTWQSPTDFLIYPTPNPHQP